MKIIPEIGLNHEGSEEKAWVLLESVLKSDIDGVTFQVREKDFYNETQPMRRALRDGFYAEAAAQTHRAGKKFGLAIAQKEKIATACTWGVDFWKTLSWDLGNELIHTELKNTGLPVTASTGVSGLVDIVSAARKFPHLEFIHTQLDAAIENVNLKAIQTIRSETGAPVAFGSHCKSSDVLILALGFEPSALWFYVKPDQGGPFPDDEHAVRLRDLSDLCSRLRVLQSAIGDGKKEAKEGKLKAFLGK